MWMDGSGGGPKQRYLRHNGIASVIKFCVMLCGRVTVFAPLPLG